MTRVLFYIFMLTTVYYCWKKRAIALNIATVSCKINSRVSRGSFVFLSMQNMQIISRKYAKHFANVLTQTSIFPFKVPGLQSLIHRVFQLGNIGPSLSQSFFHLLALSITLRSPFNNRPPTTFLRFQIVRILRDAIRSPNEQEAVGLKNRLANDIVVFARFYRLAKVPLSRAYLSDRFAAIHRRAVTWQKGHASYVAMLVCINRNRSKIVFVKIDAKIVKENRKRQKFSYFFKLVILVLAWQLSDRGFCRQVVLRKSAITQWPSQYFTVFQQLVETVRICVIFSLNEQRMKEKAKDGSKDTVDFQLCYFSIVQIH